MDYKDKNLKIEKKPMKIVEKDGFHFIDEFDDEPIILYENHIHDCNEKIVQKQVEDEKKYFENFSNDSEFESFSIDDILKENKNLKLDKIIEEKNNFEPAINQELKSNQNNEIKLESLSQNESSSINDDEMHFIDTNEILIKPEILKIQTNNSLNFNQDNLIESLENKKTNSIEKYEIPVNEHVIFETENNNEIINKHFITEEKNIPQENVSLEKNEQKNHENNIDCIDNNECYFIKPKNNKKGIIVHDDIEEETNDIDPYLFNKYIIISSQSARKLFKLKFIFTIISFIIWFISLISVGLILTFGILSKIKGTSNFKFSDYDFIPTTIFICLSLSFSLYHFIDIFKFKIAKNELKFNKKIDENDFEKITKIYKRNNILLGFLVWFIVTIAFLFALTLVIIFCVYKFDGKNLSQNNLTLINQMFYSSIIVFVFLTVLLLVYVISFALMNKTIERDELFNSNSTFFYYKGISKKSYKIGLIVFLSVTIIGIIFYGIAYTVNQKIKVKKRDNFCIYD